MALWCLVFLAIGCQWAINQKKFTATLETIAHAQTEKQEANLAIGEIHNCAIDALKSLDEIGQQGWLTQKMPVKQITLPCLREKNQYLINQKESIGHSSIFLCQADILAPKHEKIGLFFIVESQISTPIKTKKTEGWLLVLPKNWIDQTKVFFAKTPHDQCDLWPKNLFYEKDFGLFLKFRKQTT
jgi:hypothetical protein